MIRHTDFPLPSKKSMLVCLVVSFVGIAMLVVAGVGAWKSWTFRTAGVPVTGSIVRVEEHTGKKGKIIRKYTTEFPTPDGSAVTLVIKGSHAVGDSIPGLALAAPGGYEVKEDSFAGLWQESVALAAAGGFWALLLLTCAAIARRRYQMILRLLASGERLEVEVLGIQTRISRSKKGNRRTVRHSVNAVAPNGENYVSESGRRKPMTVSPGQKVTILVDPTDKRRYYFPLPE